MSVLTVYHSTTYRYCEPVRLGEHRMMFRPRESHDLRLISSELDITPAPAHLRWLHDPFDNSVAVITFEGATTELRFESTVTLEHVQSPMPEYSLEESARTYPFRYSDEDFSNLERALWHQFPSVGVSRWALQFLDASETTDTMKILRAMTNGVSNRFRYASREEKGVQTPQETLRMQRGSCRDFAVLMIEAARSLGIASRFVSGYIYVPDSAEFAGSGATHAWMQAYLPGAGWVDFDPTNGIIGNCNLIRVATAWTHEHVLPLWGTYEGTAASYLGMEVIVDVREA